MIFYIPGPPEKTKKTPYSPFCRPFRNAVLPQSHILRTSACIMHFDRVVEIHSFFSRDIAGADAETTLLMATSGAMQRLHHLRQ